MRNNPRYEQALIGTTIAHPTEASSVMDIRLEDLAFVSHQTLWGIIHDLERSNRLSYQAVVEQLHDQDKLDTLGGDVEDGDITGEAYLNELLARRAIESIREFADKVVGASIKRELHSLAHLWALDSESAAEADELLDAVEEKIYQLRRNQVDTGRDMGDLLASYEQVMDDWRADKIVPAFTFTTPGLARIIPFLEDTDFMLIAGRPGEGKSSIIRAEAFEAAKHGKKIVIFNLENSEIEYARYLISYVTGIDTWKLRKPKEMTEEEVAQTRAAIRQLKAMPLKIVSMGAPSVYEIVRIARKLVTQGYEVVFVDYLQLVKNGIENEVQDISMTSSLLRGFALKYHVPVIAAAQLNRELVKRTMGSEPQLSDLRGSGSLEQDALIVAFVTLADYTEEQLREYTVNVNRDNTVTVRAIPARLFIKKNRNGPVDKTPWMLWHKHTNRYIALAAENPTPVVTPRRTRRSGNADN
jgi:replicative DNA helicase